MSYQSITTIVHDPDDSGAALNWAIAASRSWGAHLNVLCAGVDQTDPGFYYAGAQAIAVQENLSIAQNTASEIESKVRRRMKVEDILWDCETVTVMQSGLEPFIADHSRFFDLAILPQPYGKSRNRTDVAVFETCLFAADIPVLIVPDGSEFVSLPNSILVGWDDGSEALAACRAALPLFSRARSTDICIIDRPADRPDRSDPGGRLAAMVGRHGASATITVATKGSNGVAAELLRRATELGASLVVMGAYGHSRLREAMLGGATRDMLQTTTLPVLMAH